MREIDKDGLILCEIQGKVFENTIKKIASSSEIFIRRFMNSNIATELDSLAFLYDSKTEEDIYEAIDYEYGKSEYGKIKYNKEELFWIGYIYRYFSYTHQLSSKQVYRIIKPKELRGLYIPYHSLDCSQAIERILESKHLSFDKDELLKRGLEIYKKNRHNFINNKV